MLKKLNPEIALGFFVSSLFWIGVVCWQSSYSPTEKQKDECYEAARKTGHKADECKTFWEKTTSDPVALFNLILAFSTVGLWVATISLYRAGERQFRLNRATANRQFGQTEKSIKLARETFVANQRPWLDANVVLASGFRSNGATGVVDLQVTVKNVGQFPAFSITCATLTFPNSEVGSEQDHYRRLSEGMQARNFRGASFGRMLFPGKELPINRAWTTAVWQKDNIDIGNAKGATLQLGALGICICVDYVSAVDERHYQTGFIYLLMTEIPDHPNSWMGFNLDPVEIPQDKLLLTLHPLGSHAI